ncbi:MAG: hypothetical protein HY555_04845 [Euryarchaeota archaeon]|nr:hypothetical protein [Euryarchaeota archaeon]
MAGLRSVAAGLGGMALLLALYLSILAAAQSLDHAWDTLWEFRYYMFPLLAGFGIQVGLYHHIRTRGTGAGGVAASGSVSTVSMAACCAHHVTDVGALFGITAATVFLAQYQRPLLLVGIGSNLLGIAYLWRCAKSMGGLGYKTK